MLERSGPASLHAVWLGKSGFSVPECLDAVNCAVAGCELKVLGG